MELKGLLWGVQSAAVDSGTAGQAASPSFSFFMYAMGPFM